MVKQPEPRCRTKASAGKLPMDEPCSGRVLRVRIESSIGKNTPSGIRDKIDAILFTHDFTCERPMFDRGYHVLSNTEQRNCVVIRECRFRDSPIQAGAIERFFQPHLPKREGFMPGKMGGYFFSIGTCFSHRLISYRLLEKVTSRTIKHIEHWRWGMANMSFKTLR